MRFGFLAALLSLSLFPAQVALAAVYDCALEQLGANMGWVPPNVVVAHDEAAGSAKVNDGIILAVVGQPIDAKVETDNAKRTTLSWNVLTKDDSQQGVRMMYRLTIVKAGLSARIKVLPGGYGNNFDAGGACKRVAD